MSLRDGVPVNVRSVKPLTGYRLQLTFDNDHVSVVDFGAFLHNSHQVGLEKYLEVAQFRSVAIVHGNLVWGDYEMCFPIEDLYQGDVMPQSHSAQSYAVAESKAKYGER